MHKQIEVGISGASERSSRKLYREAATWRLEGVLPESVAGLAAEECKPGNAPQFLFSAMEASVGTGIERALAEAGHVVVSNSGNPRMEPDAPLPAPLKPYGIQRVAVTAMQAITGAGSPGVPGMDISANAILPIGNEQPKVESESLKILGDRVGDKVAPLAARAGTHGNRAPVVDGHTATIPVEPGNKPPAKEVPAGFARFRGAPQERRLPSAPAQPVIHMLQQGRPQPRRDAEGERGMATFPGRLRDCPVFDCKHIAPGHNTVRGAAGAAALNAELMYTEGLLQA